MNSHEAVNFKTLFGEKFDAPSSSSSSLLLVGSHENVIVNLNVGGQKFDTTMKTIIRYPRSKLASWFSSNRQSRQYSLMKDSKGRYFIDRDPQVFQHILNFLRHDDYKLPTDMNRWMVKRIIEEAEFFELGEISQNVESQFRITAPDQQNVIIVGYRGTFAAGRDTFADVRFRKLSRILVSGRWTLCKKVFGDTLNDSRDPERGQLDRFSSRFFLKHSIIEKAFETLYECGFSLTGCCASGTSSYAGELRPGQDYEESRWQHYNEYVFIKSSQAL